MQECSDAVKPIILVQVQPEVWDYCAAGSKEDWTAAKKLFDGIRRKWRQGENNSPIAGPVLEAVLAYEGFTSMEMKHVEGFARTVIDSIPAGRDTLTNGE